MRPTTSTLPPGGKPIRSFSGLAGNSCAIAPKHTAASRIPSAARVVMLLVYPGAGPPHHLRPLVGFLAHVLGEILGRPRHRVHALRGELRADVGHRDHARG